MRVALQGAFGSRELRLLRPSAGQSLVHGHARLGHRGFACAVATEGIVLYHRPGNRCVGDLACHWRSCRVCDGQLHAPLLSDAGEIIGNGKIVVLKPETWIGKRFPLLDYIDIGEKLKEGRWFVVLYHHDCPDCQAVLPKCERLSRTLVERGEATQVALIEMPPYNDFGDSPGFKRTPYVLARLSDTKEWSVETPLQLILQNGVVAQVVIGAKGLPAM